MIPPGLPSSLPFILLGCSLTLILLSVCAVLSSRYQYNYKLLELKLRECQMEARLSDKEHTLNAQILSLTNANEGMHRQLATLKKRKDELAALVSQKETEYVQRRSELEDLWLKERGDVLRAKDQETAKLRAVEDACTVMSNQIQSLAQAKEELQAIRMQHEQKIHDLTELLSTGCLLCGNNTVSTTSLGQARDMKELQDICGRQEQKIRELTDKLSECYSRLANGSGNLDAFFMPPPPFSQVYGRPVTGPV